MACGRKRVIAGWGLVGFATLVAGLVVASGWYLMYFPSPSGSRITCVSGMAGVTWGKDWVLSSKGSWEASRLKGSDPTWLWWMGTRQTSTMRDYGVIMMTDEQDSRSLFFML